PPGEELKVFQTIVEEYINENDDEDYQLINQTWEINHRMEWTNQELEDLYNYYEQQRLELAQQWDIKIYGETTWPLQNSYLAGIDLEIDNSEERPMDINDAYQIDDSYWDDDELVFNESEIWDPGYAHSFHLGHSEYWWNTNIDKEMFYGTRVDTENPKWLLPLDDDVEMD
ncbi:11345_t:CDS:1, partial [Ambispora leptoticha]